MDEVERAKASGITRGRGGRVRNKNLLTKYERITEEAQQAYDKTLQEGADSEINAVKAYSAISFSGGGSEFTFEDSGEIEEVEKETITFSLEIKGGAGAEVKAEILNFGTDLRTALGGISEMDDETGTETQESHSFTRSFTLSDPDDGDAFDVQVWQLVLS